MGMMVSAFHYQLVPTQFNAIPAKPKFAVPISKLYTAVSPHPVIEHRSCDTTTTLRSKHVTTKCPVTEPNFFEKLIVYQLQCSADK